MSAYPAPAPAPASRPSPTTIWLSLDVHKESVTIAVLRGDAPASDRGDRLPTDLPKLKRYLERLAGQGPLRAVYEASGAGYVLHCDCTAWGVPCDVIAPSLIPTKPGVQRKHDAYDATQLARRHRAGELTVTRIPTEAEERVRLCCDRFNKAAAVRPPPYRGRQHQPESNVTARKSPIDFVLAHVAAREDDTLLLVHHSVHERVRKPMQQRAPHTAIVTYRRVHLGVQQKEGERGVELGDERTSQAGYTPLIPATRFAALARCSSAS